MSTITNLIDLYMDDFLEYWTPWIMISVGAVVFLVESCGGVRAAYGRYNTKNIGFSAPVAWLLQESPAFVVPLIMIIYRQTRLIGGLQQLNTNLVLLAYFMLHYFNRCLTNVNVWSKCLVLYTNCLLQVFYLYTAH